jgi:hypothetical protein
MEHRGSGIWTSPLQAPRSVVLRRYFGKKAQKDQKKGKTLLLSQ